MVDEADVARLHRTVRQMFSRNAAEGLLLRAGDLTGEYVLAHRIPRPVRTLLPWLPDRAAANLLCAAIRRHAWTFAGSGRFEARAGSPVRLAIVDNPMCRELRSDTPACHYYAATFERLFRALVNERASVVEVACEASGARSCRFEVGWADQRRP
jgi:divinyl protochlorophyllide a 8-vinyl-reductase